MTNDRVAPSLASCDSKLFSTPCFLKKWIVAPGAHRVDGTDVPAGQTAYFLLYQCPTFKAHFVYQVFGGAALDLGRAVL